MRLYRPFYRLNLAIDAIPTGRDLSAYSVVALPVMQIIDDVLAAQLRDFVTAGGILICSFRAGTKDRNNNLRLGVPLPGPIRDLCGITIDVVESLQPDQTVPIAGVGDYQGISGACDVWRDLAISDTADVLFRFDDPTFCDRAVISRNRVGAGQVIYVGGGVDTETLDRVFGDLVTESGLPGFRTPDGLEWYERSGPDGRIALALNHSHLPVSIRGCDLGPYESRVVRP